MAEKGLFHSSSLKMLGPGPSSWDPAPKAVPRIAQPVRSVRPVPENSGRTW